MELLGDEDFLEMLQRLGIYPDPQWPQAQRLTFPASPELWRRWPPPPVPSDLPGFILTLAEASAPARGLWLYRRGGGGWYEGDEGPLSDQIRDRIIRLAGVPEEFAGAVFFERAEWRSLVILALAFYVYGWSVGEDLYLIPDSGRCVLMTSHHGPIYSHFPTEQEMNRFIAAMAEERLLPEE